jgi:hypothetical protein
MLERPTAESDCSSSGGWNTPTVEDSTRAGSPEWAARWANGETIPETQQRLRTQIHWPTPDAATFNASEAPESFLRRQAELKAKGTNGNGCGTPLAMAVRIWPTPTGQDSEASGAAAYSTASGRHAGTTLTDAAVRGLWATPRKEGFDAGRHRGQADSLHSQIKQCATPTTRDSTTAESGKLNPDWVESLMGFPQGWTAGLPVPAKRNTAGKRRESAASATTEPQD